MHLAKILALLSVFFISYESAAIENELLPYIYDSSEFFGLESCMFLAAVLQEGGTVGEDTHHPNGSVDIGPSQISKGGEWAKLFEKEFGITHSQLRDNGSLNILFGSFILSKELSRSEDIIRALSAYHRGFGNRNGILGIKYARKVIQRYKKLLGAHECSYYDFRRIM